MGNAGLGPKGYARSDQRIFEDVCENLLHDGDLDARYIRVTVQGGVVVLDGHVPHREDRWLAERLARVLGVRDVDNRLRGGDHEPPARERGVFAQLIHEHRVIAALFDAVLAARDDERAARWDTFAMLARDLLAHAHAEQQLVYSRLAGSNELGHQIDHAEAEHAKIERMLRDLIAGGDTGPGWCARVEQLRRAVEDHVAEEEHDVIPRAHLVIDDETVDLLREPYLRAREIELARLEDSVVRPVSAHIHEPSYRRH